MEFDLLTILSPILAIFFFWKLRSVLGTRDDSDRRGPRTFSDNDNVISLVDKGGKPLRDSEAKVDEPTPVAPAELDKPYGSALQELSSLDSNFSTSSFLAGAKVAYEMIVTSFASGDGATLKDLLDSDLHNDFVSAIESRTDSGERVELKFIGIEKCDIKDLTLHGTKANRSVQIVVHFVSQMVRVVYNKDDEIIDGDANQVSEITDTWTFERYLSWQDPNWKLLATDG